MRTSGTSRINKAWFVILLSLVKICAGQEEPQPTCSSQIYCYGDLLHTIQMAKTAQDSKTFVDKKLVHPPNVTLQHFKEFMQKHNNNPNKTDVQGFVNDYFEAEGLELEDWTPPDWKDNPKFAENILDEELKQFGLHLNNIWGTLGKKIKAEVEHHQDLYSIVWVPNPFIVPGGRFREYYYWDTYWIVQGLIHSEMFDTIRGILENFLFIVENYGHIPNGGRVYYLARSQPPLMIPMIQLYFEATNDKAFLAKHIQTMEKEFDYWMTEHTKNVTKDGVTYTLAVYGDKSKGPRPESYSEDVEIGRKLKDDVKMEAFYSEIKAAAESGWDFSSRWFIKNASNNGNLTDINTRYIVPVDLNAMIYWNAKLLNQFHTKLNNTEKAAFYNDKAASWIKAVTAVLWHEEIGTWLDYDMLNEVKRDYFYPSNIAPLWTYCYNITDADRIVQSVLKYLQNKNIMYPGGIPTSVEHSLEQWDYPNAWPPLQHMMIVGLDNTGNSHAVRLAFEIAETWVRTNFKAFKETNEMYEKYDATVPGGHGGGGEYIVQKGFGWTNGVILDLLHRYGRSLTADDAPPDTSEAFSTTDIVPTPSSSSISSIATALIALLVSLTAGLIG